MNPNSMTPEEPGQPAESGTPEPPPAPVAGQVPPPPPQNFFGWIRSQGINRGPDRWMGGVASGIAHRFGIDPLIVRGIFIVLAIFAGIGVLLYGLAWALLPEPDGRIHVQEAGAGRWSGGMTGALITTIIGLPGLGNGFWIWGWNGLPGLFWTLFWIGGIVYLIYFLVQRNKNRNGASTMGKQQFAAAGTAAGTTDATGPAPGPPYGTGRPAYPAGPASFSPANAPYGGAGPYSGGHGSWNPPAPSGPGNPGGPFPPSGPTPPPGGPTPRAAKRQGPGGPIVAVSAGAALLAGGTLKALDAGNVINLGNAANTVVWATGAAVLGLGILVAGLRGRTSGFLGFLAAAALVVGGIFNVIPNGDRFRFQKADWSPTNIEQARKGFDITGGNGTVDLRSLGLEAPLSSQVVVPVDATASNITLMLPDNIPVEIRSDLTFANLKQGGTDTGRIADKGSSTFNSGKPGSPLIVELDGTFSNITIREGNLR